MGRDVMKIIEETKVNRLYQMKVHEMCALRSESRDTFQLIGNAFKFGYALRSESRDTFQLIGNAFKFGYAQGAKAAKAEIKRRGGKRS